MLPCTLGALLATLVAVAGAPEAEAPPPCEVEMNKIKDLLQVSCVGRGLSGIPPGLPPDTGILLLASNRLRSVSLASFAPLRDLVELDLSNNSLAALDPPAPGAPGLPPGLQQLDLSHNGLQSLPPLQGAPTLRRLALAHNALSRLPAGGFRALRALEDLELQGNGIRDVSPGAFEGLAKLRDVDLADNLLEELPQELLAGLGKLEILRLERNRLARLPDGFFPEENFFAYLYLAGNPWVCDCALVYLRDYIQTYETSVYTRVQGPGKEITENKPESVVCEAPEDQKGRPVIHFHAECGGPEGDSDGGERDTGGKSPGGATEPPHAHATLVSTAVVPATSVPTTRSTAPPTSQVPMTPSTAPPTTRVPTPSTAAHVPPPAPSPSAPSPRFPSTSPRNLPGPVLPSSRTPGLPTRTPRTLQAAPLPTPAAPHLLPSAPGSPALPHFSSSGPHPSWQSSFYSWGGWLAARLILYLVCLVLALG